MMVHSVVCSIDHASHVYTKVTIKSPFAANLSSFFDVSMEDDELADVFCCLLHLSNLNNVVAFFSCFINFLSIYKKSSEKEKSLFWKNRGFFFRHLFNGVFVAHSLTDSHTTTRVSFFVVFIKKKKKVSISLSDTNFRRFAVCRGQT